MQTQKHIPFEYIIFFKPYGVLCQFSDASGRRTLADYGPFPDDVYPAGRLDADSEGLVLLTNDGKLKHFLLEPKYRHARTYLVQVERIPAQRSLNQLCAGVVIDGEKTLPAAVKLLPNEPELPERSVPIRFRKNVPTAWILITLRQGRNRQVRKMTAVVGHPALRLVRIEIANLSIDGLDPGEHRLLSTKEITDLHRTLGMEFTN